MERNVYLFNSVKLFDAYVTSNIYNCISLRVNSLEEVRDMTVALEEFNYPEQKKQIYILVLDGFTEKDKFSSLSRRFIFVEENEFDTAELLRDIYELVKDLAEKRWHHEEDIFPLLPSYLCDPSYLKWSRYLYRIQAAYSYQCQDH